MIQALYGVHQPTSRLVEKSLNRFFCHLITVSGLTITNADLQSFQTREMIYQNNRSLFRRAGLGRFLLNTVSCWRKTRLLISKALRDQTKTRVLSTWTATMTSRISMPSRIMADVYLGK